MESTSDYDQCLFWFTRHCKKTINTGMSEFYICSICSEGLYTPCQWATAHTACTTNREISISNYILYIYCYIIIFYYILCVCVYICIYVIINSLCQSYMLILKSTVIISLTGQSEVLIFMKTNVLHKQRRLTIFKCYVQYCL